MRTGRTVTTVHEVRAEADDVRSKGGTVGFFGTSGNLHAGHLALIEQMATECDLAIMPLFLASVPGLLEFGPGQGYERDFDADAAVAFDAGLDIAFRPTVAEMYPRLPVQTLVTPSEELAHPWEGAENPAFLQLVATAMLKYWNVVGPCRAYFGEKDWVPLAVLRRVIEDLSPPVELVGCPIVRADDGLCESSRNRRLSAHDRARAPEVYAALQAGLRSIEAGERSREVVQAVIRDHVAEVAPVAYAEVVDASTLHRVDPLRGELRLLVSADFSGTHLFDNVGITVPG